MEGGRGRGLTCRGEARRGVYDNTSKAVYTIHYINSLVLLYTRLPSPPRRWGDAFLLSATDAASSDLTVWCGGAEVRGGRRAHA